NGAFMGYSQVSHCTSEIEITDVLSEDGINIFEVLVVKHCDGSYMEDQDFFRLSGIFRDVYVLERDAVHISDIFINPTVSEDLRLTQIHIKAEIDGNAKLSFKLFDPDGKVVFEDSAQNSEISIFTAEPVLWNAEDPKMYSLTVQCGDEFIKFPLAVKRVEIKDRCLLLNNKKIKLRGINRHDSNPETGYTVSVDDMLNDLYILKRANVNTIRTSHYPNDPRFLEMCDRLGFMVVDEADFEAHGLGYNYGDWYWDYWAHIADVPEWKDACIDRAARLFERDKNHGCVIMWSLGNESGCGENHRHMAEYIRSRMPGAIIHYENAHLEYQERLGKDFTDISDVESRMYASTEYLKEYLENPENKKPFFYCEYVSAWSTGDIPLHWGKLEDYDNYCGACVWEMTDHAVNTGTKESPKYRYGGDFGDYPNDHIYCVDGLVYPDRRERPGYLDMKIEYQPFDIKFDDGTLTIKNKRYFMPLTDMCFAWTVERNGKVVLEGKIPDTQIPAREEKEFQIFDSVELSGFTTLNIYAHQLHDTKWAKKGYEIGHKQFILSQSALAVPAEAESAVDIAETRTKITVTCGGSVYTYDKLSGRIISIYNNGAELLKEPVSFNIFRSYYAGFALQDEWKRARYEKAYQKTYGTTVAEISPTRVIIKSKLSFAAPAMPPAVTADVAYTFECGKLNVTVNAQVNERAPALPRFGLNIVMPKQYENIKYIGYGPGETYPDRFRSQLISEYETTVTENFEHYVKPVECSAHYKTKIARVTNNYGNGLVFTDTSSDGFLFNAKHYTDIQLLETKHDDELSELDETIVSIDYKMQADSTGFAEKEPWRMFNEKEFSFSFDIKPI
ncbi:MAG: DUF4981 domain-containing protein, partial [Clostridia bacterium]|nr:DUF4981 domain-containing protein [Clostridia bacterium]